MKEQRVMRMPKHSKKNPNILVLDSTQNHAHLTFLGFQQSDRRWSLQEFVILQACSIVAPGDLEL